MDKALSISEYMKQTGLSRPKVKGMIERGELRTSGGERPKILPKPKNTEIEELKKEVSDLKQMMTSLCAHLGVK